MSVPRFRAVAIILGALLIPSVGAPQAVAQVNTPPTAVDDSVVTPVDTAVHFDVMANDSDLDGDPLTFVGLFSLPASGSLEPTDDVGGFLYQPDPGFQGTDGFEYRVSDPASAVSAAIVTIEVGGTPAAPANDDFAAAQQLALDEEVFGTTVSATLEPGEPEHHFSDSGQVNSGSVWYSFVPAIDGYIEAEVQSASQANSIRRYARPYKSTSDAPSVELVSDGEFYFAGDTYWFAVDSGSDAPGPFRIRVKPRPVPSDDNFAQRSVIDSALLSIQNYLSANQFATAEPNEPAHAGAPAEHS
ncbi:MAG: Ig-like domain-containing protein, partial [Acidimicrobiia bacterium]